MDRTPTSRMTTSRAVKISTVFRSRFRPAKATLSGIEATTVHPGPGTAVKRRQLPGPCPPPGRRGSRRSRQAAAPARAASTRGSAARERSPWAPPEVSDVPTRSVISMVIPWARPT